MSSLAFVLSIQSLSDLNSDWVRFADDAQQALTAAAQEIARIMAWLEERHRYWMVQVRRWQEELDSAKYRLSSCRSDGKRDCSDEEAAVYLCLRRLEEAEEALQIVRREGLRVQEALAAYQRQAQRLGAMLVNEVPRGSALLQRGIEKLQAYVASHGPSAGEMNRSAGVSAAPAGTDASGLVAETYDIGSGGLRQIQEVALQDINISDSHVTSSSDFLKVSMAEMADGFNKLEQVVRPAVREGKRGDYFRDLDMEKGLTYENGYQRIYEAFYGSDAIILESYGDGYNVTNGYHRLFVAKQLGITSVPAYIRES